MLGLLRRSFTCSMLSVRKRLYIGLVRSQLSYGSQVWRPSLMKDIVNLERVQRRASKYILSDYTSAYKERLIKLGLFPLVMYLEYLDISFLLRCLKDAGSDNFNINSFITFATQSTRAASHFKLTHSAPLSTLSSRLYFHRLPRLWNMLPTFDLSLSTTTLLIKLKRFLWAHFLEHFDGNNPCTFHFMCPCAKCMSYPSPINLTHL